MASVHFDWIYEFWVHCQKSLVIYSISWIQTNTCKIRDFDSWCRCRIFTISLQIRWSPAVPFVSTPCLLSGFYSLVSEKSSYFFSFIPSNLLVETFLNPTRHKSLKKWNEDTTSKFHQVQSKIINSSWKSKIDQLSDRKVHPQTNRWERSYFRYFDDRNKLLSVRWRF